MASETEPLRPPQSRTAYVVERLKEDLANGLIQPGETIKQTVLAKRYGVSPTPVREALRMLESDGAITYLPHRGASVREMAPDAAVDLYRMRASAEGTATEMAVERMTPSGLALIEEQHVALNKAREKGASSAKLSQLNRSLHFTIYAQSSPLVVEYLELLWTRFTPSTTIWTGEHSGDLNDDHEAIMDAIRKGDAKRAGALMSEHILRASRIRAQDPSVRAEGTHTDMET
ncbi:GntR family transcriptional regulator [Prauserella marina]|uniref:DNA-binding transcriptional regulator, GntR family n=1 Tax=Prauserella marina TaxID=530584 RepID=A0A222VQD0_9PSEU|nr:GntR family transcriptional regulator [Prauserella marina]ASR36125.1 GntR family transcriptional regulator [Prauserella marina]PWV76862.1 GntR family transcriptional regulator [Prauserella marina]SDC99252.1 DNA-binding transcriptional regulator, GntR family [Prauserella marina]